MRERSNRGNLKESRGAVGRGRGSRRNTLASSRLNGVGCAGIFRYHEIGINYVPKREACR